MPGEFCKYFVHTNNSDSSGVSQVRIGTTGEKYLFTRKGIVSSVSNEHMNYIVSEHFLLVDPYKPEIIKTRNSEGWYWNQSDYNDSDPNARELEAEVVKSPVRKERMLRQTAAGNLRLTLSNK